MTIRKNKSNNQTKSKEPRTLDYKPLSLILEEDSPALHTNANTGPLGVLKAQKSLPLCY